MDNKYANLPGIAKNEPDSYETSDVPASALSSQNKYEAGEEDSANINKINVTVKEAHSKFNKGYLNSSFADFSDSITGRRKFGYVAEPESFEWHQDLSENPLQRFKRLEFEIKQLEADLTEMSTDEKTSLDFDPVDLSKKLEMLRKQIGTSHLQVIGARVNGLDSNAKKNLLVDYLNETKQQLIKKIESKESTDSKSKQESAAFIFKLFSDLERIDSDRINRINGLNERLANLEKIFGPGNASVSGSQIAKICPEIENKTIMGLVENLNAKLNLIDGQALDSIEPRLQLLSQKVNSLNEKKNLIEDQEKLNRVNELYKMISGYKEMSARVAGVVERLSSLNEIHQKAFQFSSMLTRLDQDQESMKHALEVNTEVLEGMKKKLDANLETIKSSFEEINQRILVLNK